MNSKDKSAATVFDAPVMRRIAKAMPVLPPALRTVGDYILRHPLKAATMTIEDLGLASGTSPAAVNRLAQAIECGGFTGLRADLVATLQNVISPVDKLKSELQQRPSGKYALVEMLNACIDNLQLVASANNETSFEKAVDAIMAGRKIYVLGFGVSTYLAGVLSSGLLPFCDEAICISADGGNENAAYRLTKIEKKDVLIAISLPRYSLDTVQLARFASERGATVVAITDSPASPLSEVADHLIYAPAEHALLTSSTVAAMLIVETLISSVMTRNKEALRISSDVTESVLSYLHLSGKSKPPKPSTASKRKNGR